MHGRKHGQVKALLPVAGKKMVDWVLERVEEAGVFGQWCSPVARTLQLIPSDAQTFWC